MKAVILTPREVRAMEAFQRYGRLSREALDHETRSSNSPDIIHRLRSKGWRIITHDISHVDAYGVKSTHAEYEAAQEALNAFALFQSGTIEATNDPCYRDSTKGEPECAADGGDGISLFTVSAEQLTTVTTTLEAANETEARQILEQMLTGQLAWSPEEFGHLAYSVPRVVKIKKKEG